MTVKPAWARKGYRPRPQADRPLWRLTPDEQRVLLITFAGGVGSIVVGAGVIGLALVLARHDRAPLSTLAVATVGVLAVLLAMRFINSVVEPPRGQKWIGDIGVIVGVAGCVVLVLTWIGIAAGVH